MSKNLKFMCEVAIFTALGIVLDYFAGLYSDPFFPSGGSIAITMIAIFIMSYRWGLKGGLCTGLAIGIIQTFYGAYFVHWAQVFLDYWGAYTVVGFAGLFAKSLAKTQSKKTKSILVGCSVLFGTLLRLACATASGVIFFAENAPEGVAPFWYSIGYNSSYLIPSGILCAIILIVLVFKAPFVFEPKEEFKSLKKETVLSISIAVAALMVIILFSGKFIYKYDAEWNKVLSSHITGFDIVAGATKEYLSGENYISFVLEPNIYARLIMFALVFIIGIMFIPNDHFKIKTILSSFMLTISFVFSFLMKSTLLANVNNITGLSFSAFYPMNLVIVVLGILAVLNLILTFVYLLKSKKSN